MNIFLWIIGSLLIAIIGGWISGLLKPKDLLSFIKWVYQGLANCIDKPYFYILAIFTAILIFLILFVYNYSTRQISYSPKKLVVALTNFHLVSGAETTDNNALISHLQDSLKVYKNDIKTLDSVYPAVRDSVEARKLGEEEKAHIVIWGSIEETKTEAEIIPRITIVKPLGKMKLEVRQPMLTKVSIAELNQITFRKRKAREITDVVLFILGLAKYDSKKYQESIEILKKIQHKNAEIFFYIGSSYQFHLEPDFLLKAADEYKNAVYENPSFPEAYYNWGLALYKLGKFEEAIEKYEDAVRINPNYAKAYFAWGVALGDSGSYEEAIEKYKETVRINPNYAEAYYNWGVILSKLGKNDKAIEKYKEAVRINPDYGVAYLNWGAALDKLGRHEEAIEKSKKAVSIDPNYAEAYQNLGIGFMNLKRKKEAKEELLTAMELFEKEGRDEDVKRVEELLEELEK